MVSVAFPHIADLGLSEIVRLKNRRVDNNVDSDVNDVSEEHSVDSDDNYVFQLLNDIDIYGIA